MKVIIAIDDSECSTVVVQSAQNLRFPASAEIRIISVLNYAEPLAVLEIMRQLEHSQAEKLVSDAVTKLQYVHPDLDIIGYLLTGDPVEEILQLSRDWNADLIIVGSHGQRGISNLWLGSVSRSLLKEAPCSVRIIRKEREDANQNILVSLEDSEQAEHLINHIGALSWREDSHFRLVNVVRSDKDLMEDVKVESAFLAANLWLDTAVVKLNGFFDSEVATYQTLIGDVRDQILETASNWPADLVMLGSHGRRGLESLIRGSVSAAVAADAKCSVEVVHMPALLKHRMHVIL